MDRATYHRVPEESLSPTQMRKADIQSWLTEHQIPWENYWLKPILVQLMTEHLDRTPKVSKTASRHEHEVLGLNVHHPELNPIELAWGIVKNDCAKQFEKNRSFKEVRQYLEIALNKFSCETGEKIYQHVQKKEKQFWETDLELEEISENEEIIEFDDLEFTE